MKQEVVSIHTADGPMDLHLFHPASDGKKEIPAIIVLQEAFGVNENIKDICKKLAGEGFLAAAPELFHRVEKNCNIPYDQMPKALVLLGSLTNDELAGDVKATYEYLQNMKDVAVSLTGAIGFCMGGFTAMLGACRIPLDFAISCYGGGISNDRPGIGFKPFMDEFTKLDCPVFLLYGEKDQSIPAEQIEQVRTHLKRAEKEYEIKVYREAGHAFLREGQHSYHAAAAPEAWKDIFSWLKQHQS